MVKMRQKHKKYQNGTKLPKNGKFVQGHKRRVVRE
jgi:hypothetical protein